MSRIRAAATARLAAVEQAGDVLRANLTTAHQWLQTLGVVGLYLLYLLVKII
jgi:hypothetical protein